MKMSSVLSQLEKLFEVFNEKYYEGKLERPILVVSPKADSAYGWCTTYKAWKSGESGFYEISISGSHMNRKFGEICATLLHEMVHLYHLQNDIKGVSRGGTYHNGTFRDDANQRGLQIEKHPTYGWTITKLNEEGDSFIRTIEAEFGIYRVDLKPTAQVEDDETEKKPKKKTSRKYVCPVCGIIVRATKEVNIVCGDCEETLVEED